MTVYMTATSRTGMLRFTWLAGFIVVLDQSIKFLARQTLEVFDSITLLPTLDLIRLHNSGAAFSFLSDASGWQRWMFIAIIVITVIIIIRLLRSLQSDRYSAAVGLSLILGGALGNGIDRVVQGYELDLFRVHWGEWYFPAFNIADFGIWLGGLILAEGFFRHGRRLVA